MPVYPSAIENKTNYEFKEPRPGTYDAVCNGVWDLGYHERDNIYKKIKEYKRTFIFSFEIDEIIDEGPAQGKRYIIRQWLDQNYHEKSSMAQFLNSWDGTIFNNAEEFNKFDLESYVGKQCQLTLFKNKNGKIRIQNITPSNKNAIQMSPENSSEPPKFVTEKFNQAATPDYAMAVNQENYEKYLTEKSQNEANDFNKEIKDAV